MNWQYHILAVGKTSVVGIAACRPYFYYLCTINSQNRWYELQPYHATKRIRTWTAARHTQRSLVAGHRLLLLQQSNYNMFIKSLSFFSLKPSSFKVWSVQFMANLFRTWLFSLVNGVSLRVLGPADDRKRVKEVTADGKHLIIFTDRHEITNLVQQHTPWLRRWNKSTRQSTAIRTPSEKFIRLSESPFQNHPGHERHRRQHKETQRWEIQHGRCKASYLRPGSQHESCRGFQHVWTKPEERADMEPLTRYSDRRLSSTARVSLPVRQKPLMLATKRGVCSHIFFHAQRAVIYSLSRQSQ